MEWLKRNKIRLLVLFILLFLYWKWLPNRLFNYPGSTVLLDEHGQLLAAQIAPDGQWRFPESDSIPPKFEKCLLNFEDEYFYWHPGFNPVSIGRAIKGNFSAGQVKSGGSTITMQLARMMFADHERNYFNKLVELLMACRIELSYSKKHILNLYSSHAPFGGNVVGLHAASWRYFGRSPDDLSWAESAVLAVLPNAPSLIFPGRNQDRLRKKRDRLLAKLLERKIIDTSTYKLSLLEPLPGAPHALPRLAPHLLALCVDEGGPSKIYRTTINAGLQNQVSDLLNAHVQTLAANQIYNACALVADVETGQVLAYVGNSYSMRNDHENYVDVIQAPRSTGSILKPFLYAFELNENKILPSTLIEDVPLRLGSYAPKNFNQTFDGLVPAHQALARSLNVPAVKMLQDYGLGRFHQRLRQLGFSNFSKPTDHYGLTMILGGGEATLFEIAGAYASMGRALIRFSGTRNKYAVNSYHPLTCFASEEEDKKNAKLNSDLLKASSIYYTFTAMTELLRPQDYIGYQQFLSRNRVAWKTGTSFGFRDAWAVGLNAKYIVAVWAGNADGEGRPELTGTAAAAPLLFSILNCLPEKKWFSKPFIDLEKVQVCWQSGHKASEICPQKSWREYPSGANKSKLCPYHQMVHLDSTAKYRVSSTCYPISKMQHQPWFVISPMQEYYYRMHSGTYRSLPPYLEGCGQNNHTKQLEITYPKNGFLVYVPRTESGKKSNCIFSAMHRNPKATLFWHLDGEFIASTKSFHQLSMNPNPGEHLLEVTDENGESSSCTFTSLSEAK